MSEAVFPVAPVGGVVGVVLEACGWEGDAK
jgi:hypothetical protein